MIVFACAGSIANTSLPTFSTSALSNPLRTASASFGSGSEVHTISVASAGRIGTPVDQILLFCFHYDPATGKYGPVVVNIVRLAGLATPSGEYAANGCHKNGHRGELCS